MKTYFLKFTDEAQAIAALYDYRFGEKWITSLKGSALDVIGTVYAPTGTMLTDGDFSYPEQAPIEGFYINIATSEFPQELRPFSGENKSGRTFASDNSAPVAPEKVTRVSPIEFKLLFTTMERIAITAATPTDPVLTDFFSLIDDPRLQFVNLDLISTQQAIGYLAQQGLIAADRIAVILAGGVS